jgi:hypothetical protein
MARHRIEDLGRILVLLDECIQDVDIPDKFEFGRVFDQLDEKTYEFAWSLKGKLHHMHDVILDCLEICKGYDPLNDIVDGVQTPL